MKILVWVFSYSSIDSSLKFFLLHMLTFGFYVFRCCSIESSGVYLLWSNQLHLFTSGKKLICSGFTPVICCGFDPQHLTQYYIYYTQYYIWHNRTYTQKFQIIHNIQVINLYFEIHTYNTQKQTYIHNIPSYKLILA